MNHYLINNPNQYVCVILSQWSKYDLWRCCSFWVASVCMGASYTSLSLAYPTICKAFFHVVQDLCHPQISTVNSMSVKKGESAITIVRRWGSLELSNASENAWHNSNLDLTMILSPMCHLSHFISRLKGSNQSKLAKVSRQFFFDFGRATGM